MKKRDTSQKRQSILDAAIQAFSNEGYDNASMDRISEIAGVSKRTVYNHFPSKEELFQAVSDHFGKQMQLVKQIIYDPSCSLEDQLSKFADIELSVVNNPTWMAYIKVILPVFLRDRDLAQKTIIKHAGGGNALVEWIKAADKDEKLSVKNPQIAAKVFSSMLAGAFTWPAVYAGFLDPDASTKLKEELIETFLCRYRR